MKGPDPFFEEFVDLFPSCFDRSWAFLPSIGATMEYCLFATQSQLQTLIGQTYNCLDFPCFCTVCQIGTLKLGKAREYPPTFKAKAAHGTKGTRQL
jgi:hypothetical protein